MTVSVARRVSSLHVSQALMDHDHYCSAIEAKELGLVDHIVQGKGHFSAEPRAEPAPVAREASAAAGA